MRFAWGTRVGSPAAVKSPRTGSATIWAACLPTDHSSDPAGLRASGGAAAGGAVAGVVTAAVVAAVPLPPERVPERGAPRQGNDP